MNKIRFPKEARDQIQQGVLADLVKKAVRLDRSAMDYLAGQMPVPEVRIDYDRIIDDVSSRLYQPRDGKDGRDG
jgi:hypothetical protein